MAWNRSTAKQPSADLVDAEAGLSIRDELARLQRMVSELSSLQPAPAVGEEIRQSRFEYERPVPFWNVITRLSGGAFPNTVPATDWSPQFADGSNDYVVWDHPTWSGLLRLCVADDASWAHLATFQFDSFASYTVRAYLAATTWGGNVQVTMNGKLAEYSSSQAITLHVRGGVQAERNVVVVATEPGVVGFEFIVRFLDGLNAKWPPEPNASQRPRPDGLGYSQPGSNTGSVFETSAISTVTTE